MLAAAGSCSPMSQLCCCVWLMMVIVYSVNVFLSAAPSRQEFFFFFIIDALLDPPAAFCNIKDLRAVAACDQRGACICATARPWAIFVEVFAKMLEVGGKTTWALE
jgi:hypothetical protein